MTGPSNSRPCRHRLLMHLAFALLWWPGIQPLWAQPPRPASIAPRVPQTPAPADETLTRREMELVRSVETERIRVINEVIGSVIAVYGADRQGGGSGVIIDPSGIALTNHHVVEGAGLAGLGGLNDGKLYQWELIGTDPGGDVAIIRMKGRDDFPWSPLGDSDQVRVGDWALAMGNPFLLAHDQVPTVTLGVVSGIERFQEGAGNNQLVYGNCIQIDSSINPGNSGGPLFNMNGEVIGINGRGSFRDRGRVNVGLGYAISSNQIRNFIPDLMATKIVEHGTLDAGFSLRNGKVVCSTVNLDAPVAAAGLELGDQLVEFEGRPIRHANQFKNLICTLPEGWPATLTIRKADGQEHRITVRLFGLPYNFQSGQEQADDPAPDDPAPDGGDPEQMPGGESPEEGADPPVLPSLRDYLLQEPGVVTNQRLNQEFFRVLVANWKQRVLPESTNLPVAGWQIEDELRNAAGDRVGSQDILIAADGRVVIDQVLAGESGRWMFDGQRFHEWSADQWSPLTLVEAKTNPSLMQAVVMAAPLIDQPLGVFGNALLDGGDKTAGRISTRVVCLDEDDDWLYCWFSVLDDQGQPEVLLRKVSSHRDGLGSGAILNDDWQSRSGLALPARRSLIRGLDESVVWTATAVRMEPVATIDETRFAPHSPESH